jgi:hypothetical protein
MIHHLYVGHFEKERGFMKLVKRQSDGAPRPAVVRPLDMATVQELLEKKGLDPTNIPDNWNLGIEEEGFIACEAYPRNDDVMEFLRQLATRTGCDVFYDGTVSFSPDELTVRGSQSERRAV